MRERVKKKTNWKEVIKKHLRLYFSQEYMHKGQLISWIISDVIKIVGLCFVWLASSKITGSIDQGYVVTYYILMLVVGRLMADIYLCLSPNILLGLSFISSILKSSGCLPSFFSSVCGFRFFNISDMDSIVNDIRNIYIKGY